MKFEARLRLEIGIIVILMMVIAPIVYFSINNLVETSKWVSHTHHVMENGKSLEKYLVDMETGERGFLITGKEGFLEPYTRGKANFESLMVETKQLVSDNPTQVTRLEKIQEQVKEWINKAANPEIVMRIKMNKNHVTIRDVSLLVEAGTGKNILDDLRGRFDTFISTEKELLYKREKEAKSTAILAINVTIFGTILAAILGVVISVRMSRKLKLGVKEKNYMVQARKLISDEEILLIDNANAPIFGIDAKGMVNQWNQTAVKISGYSKEDVTGHDLVEEFIIEDYKKAVGDVLDNALEGTETANYEFPLHTKDGGRLEILFNATTRRDVEGNITGVIGVGQDITERKLAEEELRRAQALYNQAEKLGKVGHWEWDKKDQKMTTCSEQFAQLYEMTVDEAIEFFSNQKKDSGVVHPEDRDRYEQYIRESEQLKKSVDIEYRIITRTGKERHIRLRSEFEQDDEDNIIKSFGVEQDITELRWKESAMYQAQKMEAVGQLTGGIAHDFNNLLSIIVGNLRFLQESIGEVNTDIQELFEDAMSAVADGAELTQRLLGFSRGRTLIPETKNVNETIEKFTRFLSRTLGEGVELDIELPDEDLFINVDPSQLENALLNLSLNARDAMPEGGKIIISASQYHHGEGDGYGDGDQYNLVFTEDSYIKISVTDTGTGISLEDLQHVYEPFFTTKEVGKGSGLGLSMVYGFTQQSDGTCHIDSTPDEGTTVSMYFPEVMENRAIEKPKDEEIVKVQIRAPSLHRTEVILVVEDEPRVRRVTLRDLRKLGYKTLGAENATMAKTIIESGEHIDLLFSDVLMPGEVDGYMLGRWTDENYPEIKVVLTSGYSKGKADVSSDKAHPFPMIRKPYATDKLAKIIRTTLLEKIKYKV
ncbi:MAG TPA: PAS domain S-box protein [Gammaproteobacteria bacterium]|nr:PAS domain S-box protein [Gammaproteobacteria bacterium]